MSLLRLGYISTAVSTLTQADLAAIAAESDARNTRDGITGLLLYDGISFTQVIEGPPRPLVALYQGIVRDTRHSGVLLILDEATQERAFDGWVMHAHRVRDSWLEAAAWVPRGLPPSVEATLLGLQRPGTMRLA